MQIRQAVTAQEIVTARILFQEYADALGVDLAFQKFATELENLPGAYAPPRGRLLIAWLNDDAVGCVALRPLAEDVCEMKRMYVRQKARGQAVGRALAERIIAEAQAIGYARMCLDTLPFMNTAQRLYEALGFVRRAPYYDTPVAGTIFMELVI